MTIENYFKEYPLTLSDIIALISSVESQNKILLPLINGTIIDYLSLIDSDHEAIWKAISEIEGPLDDFLVTVTKILTSNIISKITRDNILLVINNSQRLNKENLLILESSVNDVTNSTKQKISDAISKAILYIDVYYKREMQEAIPEYRYSSMINDLKTAANLLEDLYI